MSWQVFVWEWEAFQREYLATRCRLTLLTPACVSVRLRATEHFRRGVIARPAPEASVIVIDEVSAKVFRENKNLVPSVPA